jgi:predicted metal-dependent hydrolase
MTVQLLLLIHTPALRDAVAAKLRQDEFVLHWSFERVGREKSGETARREIAGVAELQPALIVIELDGPVEWLGRVRSDPATRRIPVIAIGENDSAKAFANSVGIDTVFAPQDFVAALPNVVHEHLRAAPTGELRAQCDSPLSDAVIKGLHEFNAHDYFEAHETLEHAWMAEAGPVRELYRVILQVGIAYYQIERGNYWGAHKMFLRTVQWFAPLPDTCQGINVAQLKADASAAHAQLEALGPERIKDFDRSLLKPIIYEGSST